MSGPSFVPPRGGSRRKRRARRRTVIVLGAILAILVAVVAARALGGDDPSNPTTASESTSSPDQPTTTGATTTSIVTPQLVASDDSTSRYTISANPFTVQLSFTGLCWIEARRGGSGGEVLVADAFEAGESPAFTESAIWIRLGYPAVATITVNGVTLPPVPGSGPFDVEITAGPPGG